jgi:hypothetical protein
VDRHEGRHLENHQDLFAGRTGFECAADVAAARVVGARMVSSPDPFVFMSTTSGLAPSGAVNNKTVGRLEACPTKGGGALAGWEFLGRRQPPPDNGPHEQNDYRMYP